MSSRRNSDKVKEVNALQRRLLRLKRKGKGYRERASLGPAVNTWDPGPEDRKTTF